MTSFIRRHPILSAYTALLTFTETAAAITLSKTALPTWEDWAAAILIVAWITGWVTLAGAVAVGIVISTTTGLTRLLRAITKQKP